MRAMPYARFKWLDNLPDTPRAPRTHECLTPGGKRRSILQPRKRARLHDAALRFPEFALPVLREDGRHRLTRRLLHQRVAVEEVVPARTGVTQAWARDDASGDASSALRPFRCR